MHTKKITDINGKIISKATVKDLYLKIVEYTNNFVGKAIITGIALFIAYVFYQLGYSFLYGYYFGGNRNEVILLDLMIHQIPFDIKYVTVLGILIFAFVSLVVLLSYKLIKAKDDLRDNVTTISLTVIMYILVCLLIYIIIEITPSIYTNFKINKNIYLLFYIIYSMLNLLNCLNYYFDNLFSGFILLFIHIIIIALNIVIIDKIEYNFIGIWVLIMIGSYVINSLLMYIFNKIIKISNIVIKRLISFYIKFLSPIIVFLTIIPIINIFIIIPKNIIVFDVILLIISCFIWIVKKIRRRKSNYKVNNKSYKSNRKPTKIKKDILVIVISGLLIIVVTGYVLIYSVFFNIGDYMGDVLNGTNYSNINVLNQDFNYLGKVIKRDNNTYYISDSNRKLIIITSNQVVITTSQTTNNSSMGPESP